MKSLGKQGFIYTYFFPYKNSNSSNMTDLVEYQIIKQKQSMNISLLIHISHYMP